MNNIAKAKKGGGFFVLNGFAINPHYIVTVKELAKSKDKNEVD